MFCPKCGANVAEGANFCEQCGNNMEQARQYTQQQPALQQEDESETAENTVGNEPKPIQSNQYNSTYSGMDPLPEPQKNAVYANQDNTYGVVDPREKPYTVGGWLLTFLILLIPIVGQVMPFVWAFSSKTNKSKKSFFIAYLIFAAIMIVLSIFLYSALISVVDNMLQQLG